MEKHPRFLFSSFCSAKKVRRGAPVGEIIRKGNPERRLSKSAKPFDSRSISNPFPALYVENNKPSFSVFFPVPSAEIRQP
jgi:hypothetical protein